jgi:hypothetical protein
VKNTAEKTYKNYIESYKETSKLFGFIPMVDGKPFFFYLFVIMISASIDINLGTYFICSILGFFLIAEYKRLLILRESILDLCICDETILLKELGDNKEYLDEIKEEAHILKSDRESIFTDNLIYSNSRSRTNYIKTHYFFLLVIGFLQGLIYVIIS